MSALLTSISSVVEIIFVIALGYFLRNGGKFQDSFKHYIEFLIMKVALPLNIFVGVLDNLTRSKLISLSGSLIFVIISFAFGYLVAWLLTKIMKVPEGRRGTFINMFVNANTIFIGLPLNLALFGEHSLSFFLVYYLANTVSTWAIGIFFIQNDGPKVADKKFNWKKLLPAPLLGFIVALVWLLLDLPLPTLVDKTFSMVGGVVTPLSLIYIGIVFAPAVMIVIMMMFKGAMDIPSVEQGTLIIQAAAPGLAVLPILVGEAKGDVEYATNVVTTSTVLFVIVVPILMQIITML